MKSSRTRWRAASSRRIASRASSGVTRIASAPAITLARAGPWDRAADRPHPQQQAVLRVHQGRHLAPAGNYLEFRVDPHLPDRPGGDLDALAAEAVGRQRLALGPQPHGHFSQQANPALNRISGGKLRVESGVALPTEHNGPHASYDTRAHRRRTATADLRRAPRPDSKRPSVPAQAT